VTWRFEIEIIIDAINPLYEITVTLSFPVGALKQTLASE